jgi:catechol 2,3-dioxygenase
MELKASLLDQASFLSADGYHHHVGANVWHSGGRPPTPRDVPGIDAIHLSARDHPGLEVADPDGTVVEVRPSG